MKKLITALTGTSILAISLAITGCGETSTVKDSTEVKTPGGTTKVTDQKTIKQTGDNPPPASTATPSAPKQ
jgi:hypothetical protein